MLNSTNSSEPAEPKRGIVTVVISYYRKRKKLFLSLAILAVVAAAAYGVVKSHKYYKVRYLREAESLLIIDDREGALKALKAHVRKNPDDIPAQRQLAGLLKELGHASSALRIYERITRDRSARTRLPLEVMWTDFRLESMIDEEVGRLEKIAEDFAENGQTDSAFLVADTMIQVSSLSPYLLLDVIRPRDTSAYEQTCRAEAVERYNEKVAYKAFLLWRSGDESEIRAMIGATPLGFPAPDTSDWSTSLKYDGKRTHRNDRLIELAIIVAKRGRELFDAKKWDSASVAYQFASSQWVLANDGAFNMFAAIPQHMAANCEYNAGHYSKAIQICSRIIDEVPEYWDIVTVRELKLKAEEWREYSDFRSTAERLDKAARDAFDNKNWIEAVARFKELADYLETTDLIGHRGRISECHYNMAVSYSNNYQYGEALVILEKLQADDPEYEPVLVSEVIKKCKRLR